MEFLADGRGRTCENLTKCLSAQLKIVLLPARVEQKVQHVNVVRGARTGGECIFSRFPKSTDRFCHAFFHAPMKIGMLRSHSLTHISRELVCVVKLRGSATMSLKNAGGFTYTHAPFQRVATCIYNHMCPLQYNIIYDTQSPRSENTRKWSQRYRIVV